MKPVLAHVGIAVPSIADALSFYRDVLSLDPHTIEQVDGARILHLGLDGSDVELLEPLDADSPIGRFLARRGPGIHHVCYRVANLEQALADCRRLGYTPIDDTPRLGAGGRRVAFVHPKTTAGILIELTE